MKLEFESNIAAIEYVETDTQNKAEFARGVSEASKMFEAGVKLAQEGRRAEARNLLLRATEADPENESAWLWLASISEYPEELLVFLNSVLKINPNNERALEWAKSTKSLLSKTFVQRGVEASKDSSKDFAKQCFLQAIVHDNQNEMAWLWLASVSDSEEEKTLYLQKVLEINPQNDTAVFSLNSLKKQRAEAVLQKAVRSAIADDYQTAIETLEEIPEMEEAWILKAYLVRSFDEKLSCYEKVLEINPENETAQANLIALLTLMEKAETNEKVSVLQDFDAEYSSSGDDAPELYDEESYDLGVAEENEELFSLVANQHNSESGAMVEDLPTQKLEFPKSFSEPEEIASGFEERTESFDASESEKAEFDAPEVNEVSNGSIAQNEAEFFVNAKGENFVADSQISESGELEFVEEMKAENSEADFEEKYYSDYVEDESPNSDEDLSDVYEIEADELSSTDAMEENFYARGFEESETKSFEEEEHFDFEENDSQSVENFSVVAADDQAVNNHDANGDESAPGQKDARKPLMDAECPFCRAGTEAQAFICDSCNAALSLSDLEMVLAHDEADHETIENAVEEMEDERNEREFSAEELKFLGIGYLNLKNTRKGLNCLKQAVKINPDDIVLSSQVNALAIRLAEIEKQESIHSSMPKNRTILIADDSATVRKLISGKLEKSGHEVICAVDGIDALEKLQNAVPDLILLDINMPRMDGYQVCKLIRSNAATKDVPVVMISGKDGFFDKVRGRMAGTTGYITKPFGPETLMKTVEAYVTAQSVE